MKKNLKITSFLLLIVFVFTNFFTNINTVGATESFSVNIVINGIDGVITKGIAHTENALDAAKYVLSKNSKKFEIKNNGYGNYISSIMGLTEKQINPNTGWMYTIKRNNKYEEITTGINECNLKNNDTLILYYSDYTKTVEANNIEFSTLQSDKPITITLSNKFKNWSTGKYEIKPITNISIKLDGYTVNLDEDKIVLKEGLKKGIHKLEISDWQKSDVPKVVADTINFEIDNKESLTEPHKEKKDKDLEEDYKLNKIKNLDEEFKNTLIYINNIPINSWSAISLKKLNKDFSKNYLEFFTKDIQKKNLKDISNTDLEQYILGIMAASYTPFDFNGKNLVKELYNRDIKEFSVSDAVFGLVAYDFGNIRDCYKINRVDLINLILKNSIIKKGKGKEYLGWNFYVGAKDIDPDITSMTINALSPYMKNNNVKEHIDKAINTLSYMQNSNGSIKSQYGESSESIAWAIIAATSVGKNINNDKSFLKDEGNLISALLKYKTYDGSFNHLIGYKSNYMSTEQALRAYIAMKEFDKDGKSHLYYKVVNANNLKKYSKKHNVYPNIESKTILKKSNTNLDIIKINRKLLNDITNKKIDKSTSQDQDKEIENTQKQEKNITPKKKGFVVNNDNQVTDSNIKKDKRQEKPIEVKNKTILGNKSVINGIISLIVITSIAAIFFTWKKNK